MPKPLFRERNTWYRFLARQTRAIAALFVLASGGCALSYVDENGSRHVIGLAHVVIAPTQGSDTFAGDVVDISAVGLSITQNGQGTDVALGYSRSTVSALRDNTVVIGDPLAVRSCVASASNCPSSEKLQ